MRDRWATLRQARWATLTPTRLLVPTRIRTGIVSVEFYFVAPKRRAGDRQHQKIVVLRPRLHHHHHGSAEGSQDTDNRPGVSRAVRKVRVDRAHARCRRRGRLRGRQQRSARLQERPENGSDRGMYPRFWEVVPLSFWVLIASINEPQAEARLKSTDKVITLPLVPSYLAQLYVTSCPHRRCAWSGCYRWSTVVVSVV